MSNDKRIPIGTVLAQSVLQCVVFAGIVKLSQILFRSNMFDEGYFTYGHPSVCDLILLVLIYQSTVYTFRVHNKTAQAAYMSASATGGLLTDVRYVLTSGEFYLEYLVHSLFSLLLPVSFIYGCVGDTLWRDSEWTPTQNKLYSLLVLLPLFFAAALYAHISARRKWHDMKVRNQTTAASKEKPQTVKAVLLMALIYGAVSIVLPWFYPFIITIINLAKNYNVFLWLAIFCAVIASVVIVWVAFHYLRACMKRQNFVKELTAICKRDGVELSPPRRPCASLFSQQAGIDFSLTKSGKHYDCKFVAGVFPNSPIVFTDKGEGMCQHTFYLFRIPLLHLNSRIDFAFESEGEKILIVLPIPKNIYTASNTSRPLPADTGEKIGNYRIYNATGFLHALERDCLER